MDTATEIEYEKRALGRQYKEARGWLTLAANQLRKLEDEYGFEYSEAANTIKELIKQLKFDEAMAAEFIESMEWDFRADNEVAAR